MLFDVSLHFKGTHLQTTSGLVNVKLYHPLTGDLQPSHSFGGTWNGARYICLLKCEITPLRFSCSVNYDFLYDFAS